MTVVQHEWDIEGTFNISKIKRILRENASLLFVYGTLKRTSFRPNPFHYYLYNEQLVNKSLKIDACLLDAKSYPICSVDNSVGKKIYGEVYDITNPKTLQLIIQVEKGAGIYSLYLCHKAGYNFLIFALSSKFIPFKFYKNYPFIDSGMW